MKGPRSRASIIRPPFGDRSSILRREPPIQTFVMSTTSVSSHSHPPEPVGIRKNPNQARVIKRIGELTPRFDIADETRFKFVLASALPNSKLSTRLIRVLEGNPHTYVSIFNYFQRYATISKVVCLNMAHRGTPSGYKVWMRVLWRYGRVFTQSLAGAPKGWRPDRQDRQLATVRRQCN